MSLILVTSVAVVAILLVALIPLLSGTEQKSRSQTAADAAALAGAKDSRDYYLDILESVDIDDIHVSGSNPLRGTWTPEVLPQPARGYGEASEYAVRNGGSLVPGNYSFDSHSGEVDVRLELRQGAPGGGNMQAAARAEVGATLSGCVLVAERRERPTPSPTPTPTPTPSATPTPSPTPTPTPPPPGPPTYFDWEWFRLSCDAIGTLDDHDLDDLIDGAVDEFEREMKPRLVR